jgi:hypothetical protein
MKKFRREAVKMMNPLKILFEELEVSQRSFAEHYGLSLPTVKFTASGSLRQIPTVVKDALEAAGVKTEGLDEAYLRFRIWKAKEDLRLFQKKQVRKGTESVHH